MSMLELLLLPADVEVVPVARLPDRLLGQIDHGPDDHSVTRPYTRTTSTIVDVRTARLLEPFRSPVTIVDAVLRFSKSEGLDPRQTLDDAYPVLKGFVDQGVLVAATSAVAQPIVTSLAPGDRIDGFEIVAPAHLIVDTEVYLARAADASDVALKIARPGAARTAAFRREATVLARLDGRVNPRLVATGRVDERPYLATEWYPGVDVLEASEEARRTGAGAARATLLT